MSLKPKSYESLLADLKRLEKENQTLRQTRDDIANKQSDLIHALQFTQFSIDTISEAIVWLDEDGNYVFVNDAACKNYGYTKDELLSMQMFQVDPLFSKERWNAHWQEILDRKSFTIETINKRKDGTPVPIEVTVNLVEYEGKQYNCAIIRDITEQKLSEEKLKQSAIRLAELNATKDKFFSIIAHDLRGPLGTQREFTKILNEKDSKFSDIERTTNLKMLEESSDQVYSLLENLLDWARSQTGNIIFKPTSIPFFDLVQRVIDLLKLSANKKDVTIINQIPKDKIIFGDLFMIETVLRNLISNAIKYSKTESEVTVGILKFDYDEHPKTKLEDKNLHFTSPTDSTVFFVKDTGIGMEKDQIKNLFRLDKKFSTKGTAEESGTGLGLILCKEFIDKHQGNIWVESKPGFGSTFFIRLGQNTIS
ncbi:ATP-binding protein [Leptospira sp. 2 VSF19]|uniref:histidine kinase n=1 Tax=Leptospira soteropolitanensis TaxID=2950025 RepID=A0AAW5VHB6_9LEPT|nr:PAS domain-containing sensor histidine kinase [Leptospira soteropolitanensis]MCW7491431.1 ATP-binding protein [Leptospira soteropolitanensis]MCW7499015.1 ATP-binding protein [Leptospira soteropolitanensis]MCW7521393.1 ATP-binding protein [Leptospira soteropolitanensis]MCW7525119.1 ATP-binding protein [Leptospira soteropolitanensis]MCW7528986.1 ATP-binding protein [Leptospira soteropolitanensis]